MEYSMLEINAGINENASARPTSLRDIQTP